MELYIKGCFECPMCDACDMSAGFICRAVPLQSNRERYIEEENKSGMPINPSWCPLKSEPITIVLKQN